ncbi:MAG: hypothetical protein LBJ24_04535, partial [Treponema sp.]|nr:hypothetical protein [Treponema sp.]
MGRVYRIIRNEHVLTGDQKALFDRIFRTAQANLEAMENDRQSASRTADTGAQPGAAGNLQEMELFQADMPPEDRIINDATAAFPERAKAVVDKAGKNYALTRLSPEDRRHGATAVLLARAVKIEDPVMRTRVAGEIRELRERYAGTAAEYRAPNGKPSLLFESLGEEQGRQAWYAVRTSFFKKWFGDWERAARIAEIEGVQPKEYTPSAAIGKKEAEGIFGTFTVVDKEFITDFFESKDERKKPRNVSKRSNSVRKTSFSVSFPIGTVGSLRGFFNNRTENIISHFRGIFENSLYAFSSNYIGTETRKDGSTHKAHDNIEAYHHFINKVLFNGQPYYVRFIVEELKNAKGQVHKAQISSIEILGEKKPASNQLPSGKTPGEVGFITGSDNNLTEFFDSVKPSEVSQVRDANREPLPVFHGTHAQFDIFDRDQGSLNDAGWSGEGHYFYEDWSEATQYAQEDNGHVMAEFINVREPYYLSDEERAELVDREDRDYSIEFTDQLRGDGYDGVYYNGDLRKEWTVFDSTQIKSAADSAGTFSNEKPSILFQDEDLEAYFAANPEIRSKVDKFLAMAESDEGLLGMAGKFNALEAEGRDTPAREAFRKIFGKKNWAVLMRKVAQGEKITGGTKERLRKQLRYAPLVYTDAWGEVSGDSFFVIPARNEAAPLRSGSFEAFMRNDAGVVAYSRQFASPEEFQKAYEERDMLVKQPEGMKEAAAAGEYYTTIWNEGQRLQAEPAETAETGEHTVEDFLATVNSELGLLEMVRTLKGVKDGYKGDFHPESAEEERRYKAETRALDNVFGGKNNNWNNAIIQAGKDGVINSVTKQFIRGQVRKNPLPYMEAWAVVTGDDSWLPGDADKGRYSRLDAGEDVEGMTGNESPEERRRIARLIAYKGAEADIENGTLKADDPRLDDYEEELREQQKQRQEKIARKKEALTDYQWMIEKVEANIRKQQMIAADLADDTTAAGLKASRKRQAEIQKTQNELLRLRKEYAQWAQSLDETGRRNLAELTSLIRE